MNDEELGRALGTALAAPDLEAAPYAGARLRERARRQRAQRLAVGSAAALVLVVLAAFGAVRVVADRPAGGTAAAAPTGSVLVPAGELAAAAAASPVRRLHTELSLWLGPEGRKIQWPPCAPPGADPRQPVRYCQRVQIDSWDELAELTVTDGEIGARLLPDDATILELYTRPQQRSDLLIRVGSRSLPARYENGVVRMTAPTAAQADAFVAAAGPYRPAGKTGPGPLTTHLDVVAAYSWCHSGPEGLWRQVGQCLTTDGHPVISVGDADLQVRRSGADWTVRIGLGKADRNTLAQWSAGHVGQRILYMVPLVNPAGYVGLDVNPATVTTVSGRMTTIDIPVPDAGAASALISRLRS